jgi:hypothetical protein
LVVKLNTLQGAWNGSDSNYVFSLGQNRLTATVNGDKMRVTGLTYPMIFDREY